MSKISDRHKLTRVSLESLLCCVQLRVRERIGQCHSDSWYISSEFLTVADFNPDFEYC